MLEWQNIATLWSKIKGIVVKSGQTIIAKVSSKQSVKTEIIFACYEAGITNENAIKYVLATVEHETAGTFKPVKEAYWLSEEWRKKHLRYYPFYGRGYVQITWEKNYKKFSKIVGKDLVKNPDLALSHNVALKILVIGMRDGLFTGRKLSRYFNQDRCDFVNARRIINGTDKAQHIAELAKKMKVF